MTTDIERWYRRCLIQLEIEPSTPEAEQAMDALACFADDSNWLEAAVFESVWFVGEGDPPADIQQEAAAESSGESGIVLSIQDSGEPHVSALHRAAELRAGALGVDIDTWGVVEELRWRPVQYGKPLPAWFIDFYTVSSEECTARAYLDYVERHSSVAVYEEDTLAEGGPGGFVQGAASVRSMLSATRRITKVRAGRAPIVDWIIDAVRIDAERTDPSRTAHTSAKELWRRLEDDCKGGNADLDGVRYDEASGEIIHEDGPYSFNNFKNELSRIRIALGKRVRNPKQGKPK